MDRAWEAFQTSRYSILGPQLPQLLTASQLGARELDGDARLRASGLLAESYQLAAILMLKLGESNAAWVAADRCLPRVRWRCVELGGSRRSGQRR